MAHQRFSSSSSSNTSRRGWERRTRLGNPRHFGVCSASTSGRLDYRLLVSVKFPGPNTDKAPRAYALHVQLLTSRSTLCIPAPGVHLNPNLSLVTFKTDSFAPSCCPMSTVFTAVNVKTPTYVPYDNMALKMCEATVSLTLYPPAATENEFLDTTFQVISSPAIEKNVFFTLFA